jgi:hypothetical protein
MLSVGQIRRWRSEAGYYSGIFMILELNHHKGAAYANILIDGNVRYFVWSNIIESSSGLL